MKKIILSIRHENNLSCVSANDNSSFIEFSTPIANIFVIIFLVNVKLIKEKISNVLH